tara:strand:- start:15706 stop:15867 length:162 start_codon:yes stop_codon:yes gene_type:complete
MPHWRQEGAELLEGTPLASAALPFPIVRRKPRLRIWALRAARSLRYAEVAPLL